MKKQIRGIDVVTVLSALVVMFLFTSCQKDSREVSGKPDAASISAADRQLIAKIGFDRADIVDMGEYYIVEGDIRLEKDKLQEYASAAEETFRTRQAAWGGPLISPAKQSRITVRIDNSLISQSDWSQAILNALDEWSILPWCALGMQYTTATNADIVFRAGTSLTGTTIIASSAWPYGGNPGTKVDVNTDFNYFTTSQKTYIAVHELGHSIGLRHTDWEIYNESSYIDGYYRAQTIPGTSADDYASVMNKYYYGDPWAKFSNFDVYAIQYLYPWNKYPEIIGPSTVYCGDYPSYSVDFPGNCTFYWDIPWELDGVWISKKNNTIELFAHTVGSYSITCRITKGNDVMLADFYITVLPNDW